MAAGVVKVVPYNDVACDRLQHDQAPLHGVLFGGAMAGLTDAHLSVAYTPAVGRET